MSTTITTTETIRVVGVETSVWDVGMTLDEVKSLIAVTEGLTSADDVEATDVLRWLGDNHTSVSEEFSPVDVIDRDWAEVRQTESDVMVCFRCGSDNVYYDAYVGVNDPEDVRTFSAVHCNPCGGLTTLIDASDTNEEN